MSHLSYLHRSNCCCLYVRPQRRQPNCLCGFKNYCVEINDILTEIWKTSPLKGIPGKEAKLSDRNLWILMCIVTKDHKVTAPQITAGANDALENTVFTKLFTGSCRKPDFTGGLQY